jgi:hypothetical protein
MKQRELITLLGGAAAWPVAVVKQRQCRWPATALAQEIVDARWAWLHAVFSDRIA